MDALELTQAVKAEAKRQGFDFSGTCQAVQPAGAAILSDWIEAGYAGEMSYIAGRFDAYSHPRNVMDGVKSLVMLGMNYSNEMPAASEDGKGRVARYAWGVDYHDLIHRRLKNLCRATSEMIPEVNVRGVVDTAPLLEREFAQLSGMGWYAKNTMLINRDHGSWFFLAAMLIDRELVYDAPMETSHCGTCTACLDACPTDAFPKPGVLDATRCISYLTIEHRSPIDHELRSRVGNWLLGCDVCQDVCPWNNKASLSEEADFQPSEGLNPVDLIELFDLDDDQFRARFRKTPLWRPKRRGILRNAALILGNHPCSAAVAALSKGLGDEESLIRGACAWALGRQPDKNAASRILTERADIETDPVVSGEIKLALGELSR
ncbi:MAG: tRNA epoxyqueuosine(34) reductase QueG [Planctomycetota bacterium]